jgi:hypothetical protein
MASSNTVVKKCAACIRNFDEQKAKPGIALCEGCNETYCLFHFVEHRQTLNNKLDDTAGQRDILRSRIEELPTRMSNEHLKTINDWENAMLRTVTEAAKNARQEVRQLIINEMERECSELTSKITSFCINDNCFEADLEKLQAKIEKLNGELNDLSDLHRIQLNLPTLDCSNIIHIKPFETHSLSETAKRDDCIMLQPKEEYRSFIGRFLTTHEPSTNLSEYISGYTCASPTMLISITIGKVERLVFYRQSKSTFEWKHGQEFDIRWSPWLQQFIVLTRNAIVAVDAVEKQSQVVLEEKHRWLQCMSHWKHHCLITDNTNRVFLYEMNKNLAAWLLLYCWSEPTTCARKEKITAVGLNEHHIVLSIKCDDQHRFAVHCYNMTHCSDIQLTHPCTSIQALPQGEWLLYDSSKQFYYVIDSGLEQHNEPYLSSLEDFKLIISCEEADKVLLVLLPHKAADDKNWNKQTYSRVIVYTNNC